MQWKFYAVNVFITILLLYFIILIVLKHKCFFSVIYTKKMVILKEFLFFKHKFINIGFYSGSE